MAQMAALTEAPQVAHPVVGRVVVQMRGGKHNPGGAPGHCLDQVRPAAGPATPVTPGGRLRVEPASIRQASQHAAVRTPTDLAAATGPHEADMAAERTPVGRIQWTQFGTDRHGQSLARARLKWNPLPSTVQRVNVQGHRTFQPSRQQEIPRGEARHRRSQKTA